MNKINLMIADITQLFDLSPDETEILKKYFDRSITQVGAYRSLSKYEMELRRNTMTAADLREESAHYVLPVLVKELSKSGVIQIDEKEERGMKVFIYTVWGLK